LTFATRAGQNGDDFRAVFKNAVGSAVTSVAVLTVDYLDSATSLEWYGISTLRTGSSACMG
jgi:hypothetical protein